MGFRVSHNLGLSDESTVMYALRNRLHAVAVDHWQDIGEVERHDVDFFQMDVLPNIQLGPVGQRENPNRLAAIEPGIVDMPGSIAASRFGFSRCRTRRSSWCSHHSQSLAEARGTIATKNQKMLRSR